MDDRSHDAEMAVGRLRAKVEELERRSRALSSSMLRHDVANAVGAARNALVLLGEHNEPEAATRFLDMAKRNVDRAQQLLGIDSAASSGGASARDQRNDLGGTREGEDADTFGL